MKRIKEKKKKNLLSFKLTYKMTVLYLYDLIFCSIVVTMALLLSLSISIFRI